jgi:hypothetical protein
MSIRLQCLRRIRAILIGVGLASTAAHATTTTCTVDEGSVVLNAGARLRIEIGGDTPCSGFDRYIVQQTLTIDGATLEIVLSDGYVPDAGTRFDLLDWGSLTGAFGAVDFSAAVLPSGLGWDTTRIALSGELVVTGPTPVAVPWPAWSGGVMSAMLFACGIRAWRGATVRNEASTAAV